MQQKLLEFKQRKKCYLLEGHRPPHKSKEGLNNQDLKRNGSAADDSAAEVPRSSPQWASIDIIQSQRFLARVYWYRCWIPGKQRVSDPLWVMHPPAVSQLWPVAGSCSRDMAFGAHSEMSGCVYHGRGCSRGLPMRWLWYSRIPPYHQGLTWIVFKVIPTTLQHRKPASLTPPLAHLFSLILSSELWESGQYPFLLGI